MTQKERMLYETKPEPNAYAINAELRHRENSIAPSWDVSEQTERCRELQQE
jgi:hypothetical protein